MAAGNVLNAMKNPFGNMSYATSGIKPKAHTVDPYQINETAFTDNSANNEMFGRLEGSRLTTLQRDNPQMNAPGGMEAAMIAMGPQNQSRSMQMNLARALQEQAAGRGPSLADAQMRISTDRGISQSQGLANSQAGLSAGQRARMAMQGAAGARMNANQNAVQGRIAEQLNAQQQLGGALAGIRGQDIGLASSQAGLQQQANQTNYQGQLSTNQANLAASLQAQAQKDQMNQFFYGSQMGLNAQDRQSQMALEGLKQQGHLGVAGINSNANMAAQQQWYGMLGGLGQAGATYAASDRNLKTDIKDADSKVLDFVKALKAEEYSYKDEKHGKGKFVSPMAQDLEKTEIGKSMVINTKEGKMVDYARAAGTYLSAASALNRKIDKLEERFAQALKDKGVA